MALLYVDGHLCINRFLGAQLCCFFSTSSPRNHSEKISPGHYTSLPMLPTIWTIQITIHHIIQLQRRLQGREYDLPTVRCLLGENRPKVLHKSAFQELNTWSIAQTLWNWLLYKLRILMNNLYRPHVRLIKCRTYTYL